MFYFIYSTQSHLWTWNGFLIRTLHIKYVSQWNHFKLPSPKYAWKVSVGKRMSFLKWILKWLMSTWPSEGFRRGSVRNCRLLCLLKQWDGLFSSLLEKSLEKFYVFQFVEPSLLSLNMLLYYSTFNICVVELLVLWFNSLFLKLNNLLLLYGHKCLLKEWCIYLTLDLNHIDWMQIKIPHAT